MAPKAVRSKQQAKGVVRTMTDEMMKSENRSVITAVGVFAVGVAFLHSSLAELLIPQ
ncbi:hypothetical protein BT63DRAFT_461632 [Microthyrium microscopicum]|uniref:Uncharacterized protein n=1 Tax=Microthyrium microscopicum TaxID=703497 RepID=A0A6A6TWT9_9PEZI|nr:hypothetical protein BT63DRAFT_461632 [Microthyrium microscopicum]